MIKKDYLSEVETLYVQKQVLHDQDNIPRLFAVWANVGRDVHGFAAVCESTNSQNVVQFKPVTDIVTLKYKVERLPSVTHNGNAVGELHDFTFDPRKKSPVELVMLFIDGSKWKDEDAICAEEPVIGELAFTDDSHPALFYIITSDQELAASLHTGKLKGKVGYMVCNDAVDAVQQIQDRHAAHRMSVEVISHVVTTLGEAKQMEADALKGLRAALMCAAGSEWFELPCVNGQVWAVADAVEQYRQMGEVIGF